MVAEAMSLRAEIEFLLHHREEVVQLCERALAIMLKHSATPEMLAKVRFTMGVALYDSPGQRARALALAVQARDTLRSLGQPQQKQSEFIDHWLREHGGPAPAAATALASPSATGRDLGPHG